MHFARSLKKRGIEPQSLGLKIILAGGEPIRFVRNRILGEPHNWHDMGYPYPDFVDWDGDGRLDLLANSRNADLYRHTGERDGRVTLDEAYSYAYGRTVAATAATRSGAQHPTYDYDLHGAGEVVLNGMSLSRRDSHFANSGLVVGVDPAELLAADGPYRRLFDDHGELIRDGQVRA